MNWDAELLRGVMRRRSTGNEENGTSGSINCELRKMWAVLPGRECPAVVHHLNWILTSECYSSGRWPTAALIHRRLVSRGKAMSRGSVVGHRCRGESTKGGERSERREQRMGMLGSNALNMASITEDGFAES